MSANIPSSEAQWRDQFNSALDKLANLADIIEDSDPLASRVTETQMSLGQLLRDAAATIVSARFEIDDLLAEYRHEAIAEYMVDVESGARDIVRFCLPYALACRVADVNIALDEELDVGELRQELSESSSDSIREYEDTLSSAEDDEDETTLADQIDEDISEQSRLLRHHLGELNDVASEAVYSASRGDVLESIRQALEVDHHHRMAAAAHEAWFDAVGAMSNVDTGRLGPLGEEIDMFMAWMQTMN